VLLLDEGSGRNRASAALHGFLTRDGIDPLMLRRLGRREIARYGVDVETDRVTTISSRKRGEFVATTVGGSIIRARKVLLATGVRDVLPDLPGFVPLYGASVHHCPYCDAWEHRDQRLAAYGQGEAALGLALSLRTWSKRVTACTDGARLYLPGGSDPAA
jgi:thioredoxin reductase